MAYDGTANSGQPQIGAGQGVSAVFAPIGTNSGLTTHGLVVAENNNAFNAVTPSATSGIPLISQGIAADPVFGTATISGGGTGVNSFTPFAVVAGGTTSTSQLQSIASVGTTGQVLTSNGAGALPTFQAIPASFAPNSTISLSDDFIVTVSPTNGFWVGSLGWFSGSAAGSWFQLNATEAGHPGILEINNLAATAVAILYPSNVAAGLLAIILGGGTLTINWVFKIINLSTASPRYILRCGLGDSISTTDQVNGCYFEYSDNINSGNWAYKTASASTRTTNNSSVAVTTGWHNAQLTVNAAASSVSFSVDGVSLGTAITTNIPTTGLMPFFEIIATVATVSVGSIFIDLFYMNQTLTSAR